MTGFTRQALLGILLVAISSSSVLTEALRTSRGVRGLSQPQTANSEAVLERDELIARIRARERSAKKVKHRQAKEDKEKDDEDEEEEDKEDDDEENDKDNGDDKDDKNEEDDEEVIIEEAVEEEIFMEEGDAGLDDNTEPEPESDNDNETEPTSDNESETTPPPDDANEPDTNGEAVEEPAIDDAEEDNSIPEETMPPEDAIGTDAPTNATIPDYELDIGTSPPEPEPETAGPEPEVGSFTVELAPFSISIENVQLIDEDPGIMIYLHTELKKTYDNLVSVDMIFDPSTVENRNRRQLIPQLLSYYDGYAIFEGSPRVDVQQVQGSQAEILSDQDAIEAVIAESLGMGSSPFSVSSILIEEDGNGNGGGGNGSGSGSGSDNDEGGISIAGLVLATVAACVGAIGFTAACFILMKNPDSRSKPVERGYSLPPKDERPEKAPEQEGVLNRTMDTEDEHDHADDDEEVQVYEEFAENIVKHDFEGDWKGPSPVQPTVSVRRGTLVESSSFDQPSFDEIYYDAPSNDEDDAPSDEELSTTSPDDLKRELGEQLSELQVSVKAAREKTQMLLNQSQSYQSSGQQSTNR